ncbi:hypothetical protein [Gemmata sp.]|uniref:hypothetical protein n=1 Tax=Gemmata sp. TaxID=1914242 RepID=UPI003F705796
MCEREDVHRGEVVRHDGACAGGIERRRFPSIPRATPQFERLCKGRTSVERENNRLKVFWGLDDGYVVGSRRVCAHVVAVRIIHSAFATLLANAQRQEGSFGTMKLSPAANKLQELIGEGAEATPGGER